MAEKKRFAVIGSNSFSGSDFIDLLLDDEQNEVAGISRSPEKSALFLPYKRRQGENFKFYQMDLNKHMPQIIELLDSFQKISTLAQWIFGGVPSHDLAEVVLALATVKGSTCRDRPNHNTPR